MKVLRAIIAGLCLYSGPIVCAAGRDNNILAPVQACGDGVLSGVNTISCVQTVSSSSGGAMSGVGSPAFPVKSPAAEAA